MCWSPASDRVGMSTSFGSSGNAPDNGWLTSTGSICPYSQEARLAAVLQQFGDRGVQAPQQESRASHPHPAAPPPWDVH